MLMGLVTKNAILLVDFAKVLRSRGMDRTEAIITAGRTRLCPILMTTLAMIFGMLPLALAIGAGAEMRAPMARAVVGGLITSTFLTLLVVPVMYSVLNDFGGCDPPSVDNQKDNLSASIHKYGHISSNSVIKRYFRPHQMWLRAQYTQFQPRPHFLKAINRHKDCKILGSNKLILIYKIRLISIY